MTRIGMKTWAASAAAALALLGATAARADGPATPEPLVTTVQNDEGENLLADSFHRTLYVFDVDQGKPTSQCVGDCAEVWPPYVISAGEAAGLVSPYSSQARPNGKRQLAFNGRPLYAYAPDRKIGDDKGDGVGEVWHYVELK